MRGELRLEEQHMPAGNEVDPHAAFNVIKEYDKNRNDKRRYCYLNRDLHNLSPTDLLVTCNYNALTYSVKRSIFFASSGE